MDYVLGYYGTTANSARKAYLNYVNAGIGQGRQDELTGGGLVRSVGGWSEVKRLRQAASKSEGKESILLLGCQGVGHAD